jgi:hypothetical protein
MSPGRSVPMSQASQHLLWIARFGYNCPLFLPDAELRFSLINDIAQGLMPRIGDLSVVTDVEEIAASVAGILRNLQRSERWKI